jgi:regulator of replication initiation timing
MTDNENKIMLSVANDNRYLEAQLIDLRAQLQEQFNVAKECIEVNAQLRKENEKLRRMNTDQATALQAANDECRRLLDKLHPPPPQKRTCETCQHKGTLLCNSCGGADLCFRMWESQQMASDLAQEKPPVAISCHNTSADQDPKKFALVYGVAQEKPREWPCEHICLDEYGFYRKGRCLTIPDDVMVCNECRAARPAAPAGKENK